MKYFISIATGLLLMLGSCSEDSSALYSGDSYIQFKTYTYAGDTLQLYSFAYEADNVTKHTDTIQVQALGPAVNHDRYFQIRQVQMDSVNNAVPGTDYLPFDSEEMKQACVIKAGELTCALPITLYRSDDLSKTYFLRIEMVDNDEFRLGDKRYIFRIIEFTAGLQRPTPWRGYQIDYYYGKYSQTKHKWMIQVSGLRWDDACIKSLSSDAFRYWIGTFKRKLKEINAERAAQGLGPWCDEDGEVIAFGKYF